MPVKQHPSGSSSATSCLDIRIRFNQVLPVVRLTGELDISSVHLLRDAVESAAAASSDTASIVLDLAGVTFCDVAGYRALEDATAVVARTGRQLVLYDVPEKVTRLMEIVGASGVLDVRGA